jgi:hypothetical protein
MDFNIIRIILKLININIKSNEYKHIYLHAGLYHTQNINKRLLKLGFENIYQYGAVSLKYNLNNSCVKLKKFEI